MRLRSPWNSSPGPLREALGKPELHAVLEESSVLAEDLRATNEALMAANDALEQRVSDRTLTKRTANWNG